MKSKGKLVFDKHSGKLIGFTSLGDPDLDFSTFEELEVATHALAFMEVSKHSEIYFGILSHTNSGVLSIGPTVLASSWNIRRNGIVISMLLPHQVMVCQPTESFIDCTSILWVKNEIFQRLPQRCIWFFADVPHLMKTTRGNTLRPILLVPLTSDNLVVNGPDMIAH